MIITHSPSPTQASVGQRSKLWAVPPDKRGGGRGTREVRWRRLGRSGGDALHFWRTNWSMNSFCSDSTLRRASYSTRYLKHTQRRFRGRVWRPDIAHEQCLPLVLQLFFGNESLKSLPLSLPLLRHRLQKVSGSDSLDGNERKRWLI